MSSMTSEIRSNYGDRLQYALNEYESNIQRLITQNGRLEQQKGDIELRVKCFNELKPTQKNYDKEVETFEQFTSEQVTQYMVLKKTAEVAQTLLKVLGETIAFCTEESFSSSMIQKLDQMKFNVIEICEAEVALSYAVEDMNKKEREVRKICEQLTTRIPKVEYQLNNALYVLNAVKNKTTWTGLIFGDYYLKEALKNRQEQEPIVASSVAPTSILPAYQKPAVKEPTSIQESIDTLQKQKGVVRKELFASSVIVSSLKAEEKTAPTPKPVVKASPRIVTPAK
ncbi:MAG: hypothetical protein KGJ02_06015 [Verrucomicrobiota bacterium]|nr:hypothetical protein [Verrucomicrobiota bacterium]